MFNKSTLIIIAALATLTIGLTACGRQVIQPGFFVTSVGVGDGGNLGGLHGADIHCNRLARQAGLPDREWRAYLSTQTYGESVGESARDRIGTGPWYNVRGVIVAPDIDRLHTYPNIFSNTALNEYGEKISGFTELVARGDRNRHDILTGTPRDGIAFWSKNPAEDRTCNNWTSNTRGFAVVGHHDRTGAGRTSWNAAHKTNGCSQQDFEKSGGDGLFYCFAAD